MQFLVHFVQLWIPTVEWRYIAHLKCAVFSILEFSSRLDNFTLTSLFCGPDLDVCLGARPQAYGDNQDTNDGACVCNRFPIIPNEGLTGASRLFKGRITRLKS